MTKKHWLILLLAVFISLGVGVVAGFFLGIASTQAGKAFLADLFEEEQMADVNHPQKIVRDQFQLQYPSNWKIDVESEDYDPDQMFSINSPGSAFVMFAIGSGAIKPEDSLQAQIRPFEKQLNATITGRFEKYGRFTGKGAILQWKSMGIGMNVKLFSFHQNSLNVMITQQCPEEDLKQVQPGLKLIESSFSLTADKKDIPSKLGTEESQ
jgi:hypothetical protein